MSRATAPGAATMRAIVVEAFGDAEVLRLREWPVPVIGAGEVLVRVHRAGVNYGEIMSRKNGYLGVEPPFVPGMEVAGTVIEVGDGVDHIAPGDRVCALTVTGGYAEAVAVDAATVFRIPAGVDWATAAAMPMIVPTAHALLHELGRVRVGERVLLNAAAGGIGMVLGQMARAAGARAVGIVSSAEKAEVARGYGFADVLTAAEVDAGALHDEQFDLVLDSIGGDARLAGWRALAPFGMLIAYGNAGASPEEPVEPGALRNGNHRVAGLSISTLARQRPDLLAAIAERSFALVADGAVAIEVRTVPLARAADAHRAIESRRTTGKTVLEVAG
jgi:NADPH2:quinone reductase